MSNTYYSFKNNLFSSLFCTKKKKHFIKVLKLKNKTEHCFRVSPWTTNNESVMYMTLAETNINSDPMTRNLSNRKFTHILIYLFWIFTRISNILFLATNYFPLYHNCYLGPTNIFVYVMCVYTYIYTPLTAHRWVCGTWSKKRRSGSRRHREQPRFRCNWSKKSAVKMEKKSLDFWSVLVLLEAGWSNSTLVGNYYDQYQDQKYLYSSR